jgi:hypothetical protein
MLRITRVRQALVMTGITSLVPTPKGKKSIIRVNSRADNKNESPLRERSPWNQN